MGRGRGELVMEERIRAQEIVRRRSVARGKEEEPRKEVKGPEMSQLVKQIQGDISSFSRDENNGMIVRVLGTLEEKTKQKRENLIYGLFGLLALYLIVGSGAELLCNLIGFLYPAYASMKAIRTTQKDDDTQWLIYWTVFAVFSLIDFASDRIMGWFPIYFLAKVIFLIWLQAPFVRGAELIYTKYLSPLMDRYGDSLGAAENQAATNAHQAAINTYMMSPPPPNQNESEGIPEIPLPEMANEPVPDEAPKLGD